MFEKRAGDSMKTPDAIRAATAGLAAFSAALPLAACGENMADCGTGRAPRRTGSDVAPTVRGLTAQLARAFS